ncbi:MAG: hypothetical protein AAF798_02840 [Bacteroidota bacterium]
MNTKGIGIISSDKTIFNHLKRRLTAAEFEPYHLSTPTEKTIFDYHILSTPLFIGQTYVATTALWKKYFKATQPTTKLITSGFQAQQHSNHIDLLNWPDDVSLFLANARTVSEEWEPIAEGGLDIQRKLYRFFEGHGDESLTDVLHRILMTLTMAHDEMDKYQVAYTEVYEELLQHSNIASKWQLLLNRWVNYLPHFAALPFFTTFKSIDQALQTIAPYFEGGCTNEQLLRNLDCLETLRTIKEDLEIIARQYVN